MTSQARRSNTGPVESRAELGAWAIFLLIAALALTAWVRGDWLHALEEAGVELEHLARTNSLSMALIARDARRTLESIDAAVSAGQPMTQELLRRELQERFSGGVLADFLPVPPALPVTSTDGAGLDRAIWHGQLERIQTTREPVFGWAYRRDRDWMLPVFYRRGDGSHLVVSLPSEPLLEQWASPEARIETPIGLRGSDDRILLRRPFTPQMLGASAAGSASADAIKEGVRMGRRGGHVLTRATETDNVERLIAWAEVPHSGLTVMVAARKSDLLARWWWQRAPSYLLAAVLLIAATVLLTWSRHRLKRSALAESRERETAERALETLRRMCQLARIGPWTVDPASGQIEMGPGAREIYGMAPDAPAGAWIDFPGADPAAMRGLVEARQRLLADGIGYDFVLPLTSADGSQRWVRSTATAVHRADGGIERIDGALQDVTASMLAQRLLDEKDHRLRELALAVSGSTQMLLVTDAQEQITWCNAAFERISGYALEEIRGQRPGPLLQGGSAPMETRRAIRQAIAERRATSKVRLRNFSKSGQPYWIDLEISSVLDEQGAIQSFIGLQTDVTAEIERERALRMDQERTELATRNAKIGIFERDFANRRTQWNGMMFALTGFPSSPSPPGASQVEQRIPLEQRSATVGALRRAVRDPSVTQLDFECPFETEPGTMRWLRNQCVIERDEQGKATRMVGTLLDVTTERALSAEREARAEADARNAAKTAFLASMSHELRTPLNAVIGFAQIINTDRSVNADQMRAHVARIEGAGWHLLALIDDILDLARIDSGVVKVEQRPVALAEVIADAVDLVAAQAESAHIGLTVESGEAWVLGDVKRLRQVMTNLLTNAIKYNVDGGEVGVRLDRVNGQARIEVRDTGLGMTAEQVAQLYQPFNRLGREGSRVQGTGIGLTITRTLVELMGGTIHVASQPGAGTTFAVSWPSIASPEIQPHLGSRTRPSPESAARPLRVLCVEDNEVNALVLQEALRLLRPLWAVRTAASLLDATDALRTHGADLVILDQNLPDGQGLQWLERHADEGLLNPSEVMLITADAMATVRDAALKLGVRHFITKPFDLSVLDALLDEMACEVRAPAEQATAG